MRPNWLLTIVLLLGGCPGGGGEGGEKSGWSEAFDATEIGWLMHVWGPSGDDLYAVGGEPDRGVVVHFDGDAWTPAELGVDVPLLNWSFGFGPDDVWTVGNGGTILHWDGSSWTRHALDPATDQDLWGIWGASTDDLWAVGGNGRAEGQATIYRWDGVAWTAMAVPELMRERVWAFFKVWGTATDDVWIVGQSGAILHWDGAALVEHGAGTGLDLISVWGTGRDRVAAVGGRGNGVLATWDGTSWRSTDLAPLPGMNGVWMRHPDVVHAVGQFGTIVTIDFDTHEYEPDYQDTAHALHAIYGDPGGTLTTVGGNLSDVSGPYRGIALSRALEDSE